MKKYIIIFILLLFLTLYPANNSYINASGSTFTIPSGNSSNQEYSSSTDNEYHKYNIENKDTETINKYNMQNNKNINKENTHSNNIKNNSNNNNQYNSTPKPYKSQNNIIANIKKNNYNNNKTNNKTTNSKTTNSKTTNSKTTNSKTTNSKTTNNKTTNSKTTNSKTTNNKTTNNKTTNSKITNSKTTNNKITIDNTIEFSKHFIKIPVGKTMNISLKTNPKNLSYNNIIYKSNDTSIATFKNKKITGIKQGFTTIILVLPDGTIKAACPVKVI